MVVVINLLIVFKMIVFSEYILIGPKEKGLSPRKSERGKNI